MKSVKLSTLFNLLYFLPLLIIMAILFLWQFNLIKNYHYEDLNNLFEQSEKIVVNNLEKHKTYIKKELLSNIINRTDFNNMDFENIDFLFIAKNKKILKIKGFSLMVDVNRIANKIIREHTDNFNLIHKITIDNVPYFMLINKEKIISEKFGKVEGEVYGVSILNHNLSLIRDIKSNSNLDALMLIDNNTLVSSSLNININKILTNKNNICEKRMLKHKNCKDFFYIETDEKEKYLFRKEVFVSNDFGKLQLYFFIKSNKYEEKIKRFINETIIMFLILTLLGTVIFFVIHYKLISKLFYLQNYIKKSFINPREKYENSMIKEIDEIALEFKTLLFNNISEKERFDLAIKSSESALWDWNPRTNITYYSQRWGEIIGYESKEITNNFYEFESRIHKDDLKCVMQKLKKHLNGKTDTYEAEFRIRHKDGHYIWIYTKGKALFNKGKAYRVIGFNTDMTEKKEMERKLLQSEKFATMGEMISMIAHQWRQPLNSISLTANNIRFKLMMNDEIDKNFINKEIELISSYSQHLSNTIDDFRNFFKENKTKIQTSIEVIINESLEIIRDAIQRKNITISTDYSCNKQIEIYSNELKQVILNLMKNSEDALLENEIKDAYINIKTSVQDKNCILEIKDNGGGIPSKYLLKIFDPYFSTKKEKEGTGLGLYMSKIIVEEHCKGKLEFKVLKNETTAIVMLPLKEEIKNNES